MGRDSYLNLNKKAFRLSLCVTSVYFFTVSRGEGGALVLFDKKLKNKKKFRIKRKQIIFAFF